MWSNFTQMMVWASEILPTPVSHTISRLSTMVTWFWMCDGCETVGEVTRFVDGGAFWISIMATGPVKKVILLPWAAHRVCDGEKR